MESKNYNSIKDDSKFQEVTKMLQELPKVKAEDNFEFNLMTKIQNRNFDSKKYKENSIGWSWIYAPATALVLSAVLIFFIINPEEDFDNPLMQNPPLRTAVAANFPDTMISNSNNTNLNNDGNSSIALKSQITKKIDSYLVVLQPNDVVVKEKMKNPFGNQKGIDLDNYASRNGLIGQSESQLAGYDNNYFEFDGFFVRENPDKDRILREKARLDSLKRTQLSSELK